MKSSQVSKTQRRTYTLKPIAAMLALLLAAQWPANVALANGAFGTNTDISGATINVPTYFASSPQGIQPAYDPALHGLSPTITVDTGTPIRKFVDPLGGAYHGLGNLPGMSDLQAGIPLAIAEKNWRNPASGVQTTDDYYELAVVEYTEQMHSDLAKPTRLRGYVQIETPAIAAGLKDVTGVLGSEHIEATYPDGKTPILKYNWIRNATTGAWEKDPNTPGQPVFFVHKPHYLGPVIIASKGKPVRIKFTNYLPYNDASGAPVGSPNGGEIFVPTDETIPGGGPVLNADGSPKLYNGNPVKMGQNRAAIHWHGGDTPWISDGTPHQTFSPAGDIAYTIGVDATHPYGMGRGESAAMVPDMADPGPGSYTLFFPNNLSGRLMMYHDHTSGLTRTNVYTGMAAGYVVTDPVELTLAAKMLKTPLGTTAGGLPVGVLDAVGIPLVVQDKGFVPKNIGPNAFASDGTTPQSQDAKWDLNHWGQPGDLFFPHVYETNQDPNSADGTNPVGRWDWGPWFWPVFPAQYSLPSGNYGDVTTTPEAFMDTAVVNGQVYPTMTVDPKTYRLRILSVANDRAFNFSLFQAVDAKGVVCDAKNTTPAPNVKANGGTAAPAVCTEVKMVPAVPTAGFPAEWPTDGRVGGVPDPATAGPDFIQIGSEGGLLPAPAIVKAQPVTYETDVRSITVFNVLKHGLILMGGERADVFVDFSKYAGQTLILYNDAPAPLPGFDPRIDYYTGVGDQIAAGGAYDTPAGYGPNTRTIMQIKVNPTNTSGTGGTLSNADVAALYTDLPKAYAATQPKPNIPQTVYNAPFGTNQSVDNYAAIGTGSLATNGLYTYVDNGATKTMPVINKAIQELFDPVFGRMNATLAVELPFSSATVATTIPLAYIDEPVDRLDSIPEGVTQIWKITHNGVDSHPVHFHLVNVQVLNRVGWDGTIKPPHPNEMGWKETLRMNPLEDVYLAVRASRPVAPFGVPTSSRLLDPSQEVGSQAGFTQIDPTTGQAPTGGPYKNKVFNFDNEYVWHCHILGHEEFDFMRPFIFHPTVVAPDAPATVNVNGSTVSWTDTTPYGGQDANGIPTAGTNLAYPEPTSSPKNEIGFKVYNGDGTLLAAVPANVTSWTDTTGQANLAGVTVVAYNAAGPSLPGTSSTTTSASTTQIAAGTVTITLSGASVDATGTIVTVASTSGLLVGATVTGGDFPPKTTITAITSATTFTTSAASATRNSTGLTLTITQIVPPVIASGVATAQAGPAGPTGVSLTQVNASTATLSWTAVAGATGYTVNGTSVAATCVPDPVTLVTTCTATVSLAAGINTFAIVAEAPNGTTEVVTTNLYNGIAYAPVALTASHGNQNLGYPRGSVTLSWANHPKNVNNVTGLRLSWTQQGGGAATNGSITFAPTVTGTTVINLSRDKDYNFTLTALTNIGNSSLVSVRGLSSP